MHAAWDQYSKVELADPQYSSSMRARPIGPTRAKVASSCDRARTEIVSSWTARTRARTEPVPPSDVAR